MIASAPTIALLLGSILLVIRVRRSRAATYASWSQQPGLLQELLMPTNHFMNRVILLVDRMLRRALPLAGAHRMLLKWRAWQATHFGEPEIRLLRYLVDPMRAAIDIGAAEGVYSFFLQRLALRCIAFEPNPSLHFRRSRFTRRRCQPWRATPPYAFPW